MKKIKKLFASLLIMCTIICACPITNAKADSCAEASAIILTAENLSSAYDASVVSRMAGRAGAKAPTGAKGIAFEIMLEDKLNIKDILKKGTKTDLSVSSTDTVADLVTTKNGTVERLIQCKDGVSSTQIKNVIDSVEAGKYEMADLVGTTEFAKAYNEKAITKGVETLAEDSGISTKSTSRVADKALSKINLSNLKSDTIKAGTFGAVISTIFSIAESIANDDSASKTVGNVVVNDAVTTITTAICPLSEAAMSYALTACGASASCATIGGTIVSIVVPCATGYVLYLLVDEINLKETIATAVSYMSEKLIAGYEEVAAYVSELSIQEVATENINAIGRFFKHTGELTKKGYYKASSFVRGLV